MFKKCFYLIAVSVIYIMIVGGVNSSVTRAQTPERNTQLYGEWQSELADDGGVGGRVGHYSSIALDH